MRVFICFIVALSFVCCTSKGKTGRDNKAAGNAVEEIPIPGNKYALGFMINRISSGFELTLMDPWNRGNVFEKYLVSDGDSVPGKEESGFRLIRPPFNRWAVSSTTHIGFMNALGESQKIVGSTSPDRIYDSETHERFKDGEISKIGSDMEFNFESVLGIKPDIILQTAFEGQQQRDNRLLATGMNFVYILEWLEPHPLGRAEWIKVFGLLTGKQEEAESIFGKVSDNYYRLREDVSAKGSKPLVMIGNNFNGTWYMPGGGNYMCRFLEDAGFSYPYFDNEKRGSLALNFENVLKEFRTADIWLNVSASNLDALLQEDSRYSLFKPYASGKVYSVSGRVNSGLGNDYWESGVVYPDRILEDLVSISNPDILPDHKLMYYKNLGLGN